MLDKSSMGIFLWIRKPQKCNKLDHRKCTLSGCYEKCYQSITPNGACGFIHEYVINEHYKLPINERDDSYIDVNSMIFLKAFDKHVRMILNENRWNVDNSSIKSWKYKYEYMIKWLRKHKGTFYECSPMLPDKFWFGQEVFTELNINQNPFTIFALNSDPTVEQPYISDDYLLCDYKTQFITYS